MTRILLSGCNGKMGTVIAKCVKERPDMQVVAGVDINTTGGNGFPVYASADACHIPADVLIDFSHPSVTGPILDYAVRQKLPTVIATTGLGQLQIAKINEAARSIPVFFTANMSLGINLMLELAKKAAQILENDFDIEIIEQHHNQKIDAPSGTALMLANAIGESLHNKPQYVYDRHSQRKKREKGEIGIHSLRGGTIVGEHEVIFAGRDEVLTIRHGAMSKDVFATGAINAAIFLIGKAPGLYNMSDLI